VLLLSDVFQSDLKTAHFNVDHWVNLLKRRCLKDNHQSN